MKWKIYLGRKLSIEREISKENCSLNRQFREQFSFDLAIVNLNHELEGLFRYKIVN